MQARRALFPGGCIQRQKSEIAAGIARQQTDAANLHRMTGRRLKAIPARKGPAD
jgi:hypothetical protein